MTTSAAIGIIGAGPAGARAAELLATAGVDVVLLDPQMPWEKPCGGGLTPPLFDDVPELRELKADSQRIVSVRIEVGPDAGFTLTLDRPLWVVSRAALGRWQLERARAAGATHLPVKVRAIRRSGEGWALETDGGVVAVPFLVGADGAASLVRRVAAPKMVVELAPTRVAYPRTPGPTPDTIVLQFYQSLAGYLWDFPRSDHRSVGIGVPSGTWRRQELDIEIDQYRDSSQPCRCSVPARGGAVIATAQLGHGDYSDLAGDGYALLGDAAGLADPLTGEGIHNAFRSAHLFADAWLTGNPSSYPRQARDAFEREFRLARRVRRHVFETRVGTSLIERAVRGGASRALVAAIMNSINEHELGAFTVPGRWFRSLRKARRAVRLHPEDRRRIPTPCLCGHCGPTTLSQSAAEGSA